MLSATCPVCGEQNADYSRAHKAAMQAFWVDRLREIIPDYMAKRRKE